MESAIAAVAENLKVKGSGGLLKNAARMLGALLQFFMGDPTLFGDCLRIITLAMKRRNRA